MNGVVANHAQGELRCSHPLCGNRCGDRFYTVKWTFASASRPGSTSIKVDHHVCPECAHESATAVFRQPHVLAVDLYPNRSRGAL